MAAVATPKPSEPSTTSTFARWTPSIPTNLVNMFNPFASASAASDDNGGSTTERSKSSEQSRLAKASGLAKSSLKATGTNGPPSPSRNPSVMFAEPETRSTSESGSREGSIDGSRRLKKSSRARTSFSICHPPPTSTTRQKLHRRPRSLLQLHRLSAHSRPLPAFEVIPSANFSVRMTRAITRVFKARHGLCVNDLVIFKAEKYNADEDEDEHETRDVIGLICKGRKDEQKAMGNKMRIHMASGNEWEAYPTAAGGYEFFTTDEHGLALTLRWVPKRLKDGRKACMKDGSRRFNFSIISPNTRKHPVVATLNRTGLEILESYKLPKGSISTPLSTPKQVSTILGDVMEEEDGDEHTSEYCVTDDALREIITVTSIWVTLKEGWSPSFRYDNKDPGSSDMGLPSGSSPSKSTPLLGDVNSPPASPLLMPSEKRASIKSISSGIVRRASLLSKGATNHRASTFSIGDDYAPDQTPSRSPSVNRVRADSTSAVLVQRATSNSRRNKSTTYAGSNNLSAYPPTAQSVWASSPRNSSFLGRDDDPHTRARSPHDISASPRRSRHDRDTTPTPTRATRHGGDDDDDDDDDESDSDSSEDEADEDAQRQPSSALNSSSSTAKTDSTEDDQLKTPTAVNGKKEKRRSRRGEKEKHAIPGGEEKTKHRFGNSLRRLLCGRSGKKNH